MQIVGEKVKHKIFGIGTVVKQGGEQIEVDFANSTKKFKFPDVFEKFLIAENESIHEMIIDEIRMQKENKYNVLLEKVDSIKKASDKSTSNITKKSIVHQRNENQKETFFVFQGNTFDEECKGGYLWAPIHNKSGQQFHHWDRLLDVRKGDIIFHGCNGQIYAISEAKDKCFECVQPEELRTEMLWDLEGRKVECQYTRIENPLKTSTLREEIIQYCVTKYSPFDKDGNGNMGYLYSINRNLAYIFMKKLVEGNQYLMEYEYVRDFLEEMEHEKDN